MRAVFALATAFVACQSRKEERVAAAVPSPTLFLTAVPVISTPAAVYRIGDGVQAPVRLHTAPPVLPESKKRAWTGGLFLFEALIDEFGTVRNLKTLRRPDISPPWPELEEACGSAVLAWKYKPLLLNGKPVPVYLTVSVNADFH